jgi:hypothetical protein
MDVATGGVVFSQDDENEGIRWVLAKVILAWIEMRQQFIFQRPGFFFRRRVKRFKRGDAKLTNGDCCYMYCTIFAVESSQLLELRD